MSASGRLLRFLGPALLIFVALRPSTLIAQTCSCGGPPLMGTLETPATATGAWQFGLSYNFSSISDLFNGVNQRQDDLVDRSVNSGALQIEYGLTNRLTLSSTFSLLSQSRRTSIAQGGAFERVSGVGDGTFLAKYSLLTRTGVTRSALAVGLGVKIPLGRSRVTNELGIPRDPDLQPGTGAWDPLLWASASQLLSRSLGLSAFGNVSFRFPSENEDFFITNTAGFEFGDEFITNLGLGLNPASPLGYTLALRYRWSDNFATNRTPAPNTGGKWLNLAPGVNYSPTTSVTLRGAGQIPIYREVIGTQFTTSYSFSFSVFYTLAKSVPGFTGSVF
ncbi:MAG: hypothetical protein ACE5GA_02730 [Candidatus Zixiibacteriota bacterium]